MNDLPLWLKQLSSAYGRPAPAVVPDVWPDAYGRGLLLAEPSRRPISNANTIRLVAPGLSAAFPDGYVLYTDDAGDYVNPATGATRARPG